MPSFVFSNTQVESLIECLQLLQQRVITIAHNSSTINPTSQTRANGLLTVAIVQENHTRPILLVPKRSPNRLIHGFYAEIGVVILPKPRPLLVQIFHLFLQHHVRFIGIGHANNGHTATQIIAEIDPFGEFSTNHSKQKRSFRWVLFQIGRVRRKNVLFSLFRENWFKLVEKREFLCGVEKAKNGLKHRERGKEYDETTRNGSAKDSEFGNKIAKKGRVLSIGKVETHFLSRCCVCHIKRSDMVRRQNVRQRKRDNPILGEMRE